MTALWATLEIQTRIQLQGSLIFLIGAKSISGELPATELDIVKPFKQIIPNTIKIILSRKHKHEYVIFKDL